ncbi:MAG: ATP-binding protein [Acidobacteriota bacterium]
MADGVGMSFTGDPVRLRQVLINLLDNAVEFTSTGHVQLTVRPYAAGSIEFSVADTDIGLSLEVQSRIAVPMLMVRPRICRS